MADTEIDRDPIVTKALSFQQLSGEAFGPQRERENGALEFQVPAKQWPENVRALREGQTVQGVPVPARPMLSIPTLEQPINLIKNQWFRAHYGINIHPVSQDADDDTAEVIQGLYRSIERDSRAYIARGWAFDRAVRAGFGAYRVMTVPDETTGDPFDQKIVIARILRQGSVFWDPFAQEPDFCDQKECLIVSYMKLTDYKREYPKARLSGLDDSELNDIQVAYPIWIQGEGEQRAVCVAEYFYTEHKDREWVIKDDGEFGYADELAEGEVVTDTRRRKVKEPIVKWCKINAVEVLEEVTWNGKYIPVIPTIGMELQPFDSERRWHGVYEPNADAARMVNYMISDAVEKDALQTKAPWIGAVGQFKTNQAAWAQANTRNFPYIEYDPIMAGGTQAPPPQRNLQSVDLSSKLQLIQVAKESVQVGTAFFDPSLGRNDARESGKAIVAQQQQGDLSQSHFLANMADVSMTYEAKVVLDLIPKIYDRPGRVARTLGEDLKTFTEVVLNQPFYRSPKTQRAVAIPENDPQMPQGPDGAPQLPQGSNGKPVSQMHYDLTKGTYGVVVDVSKSYKTRAAEGADAFGQVLTASPELIPVLGDLWFDFQDFPGHKEAAERLRKMQPPQLKDKQEQDAAQLEAQAAQMAQVIEGMTQKIDELQKIIETDAIKAKAQMEQGVMKAHADIAKAQSQDENKKAIEVLKGELAIAVQEMKGIQAANLELLKQSQANRNREDEQKHEASMASADAGHAEEQAEKAAKAAIAQGAVGHSHALEQGEQSHAQAVDMQARQPKPKAGDDE